MDSLIIGGHRIEYYSSIDDTPIPRYMNFNRLVMLDAGIGSDLAAIDAHDKRIIEWIRKGDLEKAEAEVRSRNQAIHWVLDNTSPSLMSFAVLVRSIDNEIVYDISDSSCKKLVQRFGEFGATKGIIDRTIQALKKNFNHELEISFPEKANNPRLKESFIHRKKRVLLILKKIINNKIDVEAQIKRIDDFLLSMVNPQSFTGSKGFEASYIRSYEEMSFFLSQHTSHNPKEMTVREYMTAFDVLKKQLTKKK